MRDRLDVGGAFEGALPRLVPIRNGALLQAGLGVVVRDELGLLLDDVFEPLREHLGDAAVLILARALEHGLVRGVLDEGVLEDVARIGRHPGLVEHLGVHELAKRVAEHPVVDLGDRLQEVV